MAKDCKEVDSQKSGVFVIKPLNSEKSFPVYCDMETEGGGWTVSLSLLIYTYSPSIKRDNEMIRVTIF